MPKSITIRVGAAGVPGGAVGPALSYQQAVDHSVAPPDMLAGPCLDPLAQLRLRDPLPFSQQSFSTCRFNADRHQALQLPILLFEPLQATGAPPHLHPPPYFLRHR